MSEPIILPPSQPAASSEPAASSGPAANGSAAPEGVGAAAKNLGRAVGRAAGKTAGRAAHGVREQIRKNPTTDTVYRTGVGVVGGATVALGVVMIPLPGPGALVAIGGLGILSTEFEGAKKARVRATGAAKRAMTVAKDARDRRRAAKG